MLQFEEVKQALTDLEPELRDLADALGLEKNKRRDWKSWSSRQRRRDFGMIWRTPKRSCSVPVR